MVPYPPPAIVSGKKLRSVVEYQVVDGLDQTKSRSPFMTSIIKKHFQKHSSCTYGIRVLALNRYFEEFTATVEHHIIDIIFKVILSSTYSLSSNEVTNPYIKTLVTPKILPQKWGIFFFFLKLSGPKESRWDTFELTQTLQRVLGSHFKFGGKFKICRLLHKTQQYGCLWTPMDLSN